MKLKKYISMILAAACFMPQATVSLAAEPEITANETSVEVKNAPDGSSLIMAFYDDIILTGAKLYKVSGDQMIPYDAELAGYINRSKKVKGFLWDMKALKPVKVNPYEGNTADLGDKQISDELVLINGGSFTMGSPEGEPERYADEILHNVSVGSFYLSDKELTQKEYRDIMGADPSEQKGDELPVTNITWYDAVSYCNKLSEARGLTPAYTIDGKTVSWNRSANGYRLPTEAEWEYAARANTDTPFTFGSYVNDSDANCYNAYGYNNDASGSWVNNYLSKTVNVDSYNKNANGLYNVHGNAAEWVWDWYGEYDENNASDPTGAESGNYKVARGGGWNDFPKHIRSAYRNAFPADVPLYSIGMRVARNADSSSGVVKSIDNAKPDKEPGKVLIAYFSQTGNTEGLASIIEEMTGADIFRIERSAPYSATYNSQGLYAEALVEYREQAVPELKAYPEAAGLNMNDYDTILLGYCNWWASIPAPLRSFLKHYDLSGKTIIPFCSMGGGRFGQTISAIAKLAPHSTIKKGLDVTYSSYDRTRISDWLKESGMDF